MEEIKCECIETVNHPLIVCHEKKCKITFRNTLNSEIKKIKVDGCQITDQTIPKCDFLLIKTECETEFFVELKGHDIDHALHQIESTIGRLSKNPKIQNKFCFVISVRTPMASTQIQQKQREYKNKYNAKLVIKNSPHQHLI